MEDLGGQIQSLAELGRRAEFVRHAQRLVDLAQDHFLGPEAGAAFLRCGHTWLRKERLEMATGSYALALALILNHFGPSDIGTMADKLSEAFFDVAAHAYANAGPNTTDFYQSLYESMNHLHPDFGESFKSITEDSRSIIEQRLADRPGAPS